MRKKNLVSIIITTKNEESNIENCLKSVKFQSYKNIEIILVDNFSNDKTRKIAKKYTNKIFLKGKERSDQRNYGIKKSRGEFVLYLDADMIITQNLIKECINFMNKKKIDGIFLKEKILGKSLLNKIRDFERDYYNGTYIDAIRFFKKKCFIKTGKFDNTINGFEDWDFSIRFNRIFKSKLLNNKGIKGIQKWPLASYIEENGLKLKNQSECIIHNETNISLRKLISKKNYYSGTLKKYKKKYKKSNQILFFQLSAYNRLIGVFIYKDNLKKTLISPFKFFGLLLLKLILAFNIFLRN